MKRLLTVSAALLCTAAFFAGCNQESEPGRSEAAHTETGSCAGACGTQSDDGCWCDAECVEYGDCCGDKALACDDCRDGTVVTLNEFEPSTDDKKCKLETKHCITNDGGACPQFSPMPPDYCPDGTVVQGPTSHIPSADGMECEIPSHHCVTNDWSACPMRMPLNPDYCSDGEIVNGDSSFMPSSDGMECEMPSVHCVTTNASACDGGSCEDGVVKVEEKLADIGDGLSCVEEVNHCVTNDFGACPQASPLPPDYCPDGRIVAGPNSYMPSADGMECEMHSMHCVTEDWGACPLFSPLPPDYCEGGEVKTGADSFIPSTDGMECQIPSVHCVQADQCE